MITYRKKKKNGKRGPDIKDCPSCEQQKKFSRSLNLSPPPPRDPESPKHVNMNYLNMDTCFKNIHDHTKIFLKIKSK